MRLYDRAAALLTELNKESPEDINLAASLIQTISLQAADAGARNDTDRERSLNEKAAADDQGLSQPLSRQSRLAANRVRLGRSPRRLHAGHRAHARNGQGLQDLAGRLLAASPALRHARPIARSRPGLHRSTRAQPPPARRSHPARAGEAPPERARRGTAAGQLGARRRKETARRRAPASAGARRVGLDRNRTRETTRGRDRPAQGGRRGQPAIRRRVTTRSPKSTSSARTTRPPRRF